MVEVGKLGKWDNYGKEKIGNGKIEMENG